MGKQREQGRRKWKIKGEPRSSHACVPVCAGDLPGVLHTEPTLSEPLRNHPFSLPEGFEKENKNKKTSRISILDLTLQQARSGGPQPKNAGEPSSCNCTVTPATAQTEHSTTVGLEEASGAGWLPAYGHGEHETRTLFPGPSAVEALVRQYHYKGDQPTYLHTEKK